VQASVALMEVHSGVAMTSLHRPPDHVCALTPPLGSSQEARAVTGPAVLTLLTLLTRISIDIYIVTTSEYATR
jgi:hypothetical protein